MTSESSEKYPNTYWGRYVASLEEELEVDLHRDADRAFDDDGTVLPGLARLLERAAEWDDEPTHEKWRRGAKWR